MKQDHLDIIDTYISTDESYYFVYLGMPSGVALKLSISEEDFRRLKIKRLK